jgi:hypothetical protein
LGYFERYEDHWPVAIGFNPNDVDLAKESP